jgi:hypothetical protein
VLFFGLAKPMMWANARLYRRVRAPRDAVIKVHIGPGQGAQAQEHWRPL